ncbi:MAG TPA: ISNCY family transposase [Candidatus Angelobacter sp.]|nr:ISNCY family transposase [Candidatus Angelobacter sp.]
MSSKERRRLEVMSLIRDKKISLSKGSALLHLSVRQMRRVWKRYQVHGDAGLIHKLRGRRGNRALKASLKRAVLQRYAKRYAGFGATLAAEKLQEDGLSVRRETLWRWLLQEGLWTRRHRRKLHRSRRERRSCLGEMVQMDGSHHDWFEGRGERCVLMVMIDDATSRTFARFSAGETTAAVMELFGSYVRQHGLPQSLYVDRDSIYRSDRQATVEEELRGQNGPATQFARAMAQLDVELILANSPQAKGRVERMNGTLQDRLVKEMRLEQISDIASANRFLVRRFLPTLNARFSIPARENIDVHRALPVGIRLDEVLSFEQKRRVSNDWCVMWRNRIFQLERRHEALALAGGEVTVREKLDGTIQLLSQGHKLHWEELGQRPVRVKAKPAIQNNRVCKSSSSASHPWRAASRPRVFPPVSLAPAPPTQDLPAERQRKRTVLLQQK